MYKSQKGRWEGQKNHTGPEWCNRAKETEKTEKVCINRQMRSLET